MSELKVYHCNEWHNEYTEFYLKSEADKLIERKDKAFKYAQAVVLIDIEIIKKQKIKRCLSMARWCESRSDKLFEDTLSVRDMGLEPSDELTFKLAFFRKWHKRWLELAEKFKEEK